MPLTKSVTCRYHIINQCLTSKVKRYWSWQELLEKLAENDLIISYRTLKMDIEAMRFDERLGYAAPIRYCQINKGYHYALPDYSIYKLTLTDEDVSTLLIANTLLRSYDNLSCIRNLSDVVRKILAGTPFAVRTLKEESSPEVLIASALPEEHCEKINLLLGAIKGRRVVEIAVTNEEFLGCERSLFHPYYLHEFESSWYIAGLCEPEMTGVSLDLAVVAHVLLTDEHFERLEEDRM